MSVSIKYTGFDIPSPKIVFIRFTIETKNIETHAHIKKMLARNSLSIFFLSFLFIFYLPLLSLMWLTWLVICSTITVIDYVISKDEYKYLRKIVKHPSVPAKELKISETELNNLSLQQLIQYHFKRDNDKIIRFCQITDYGKKCIAEYKSKHDPIPIARRANVIAFCALAVAIIALVISIKNCCQ